MVTTTASAAPHPHTPWTPIAPGKKDTYPLEITGARWLRDGQEQAGGTWRMKAIRTGAPRAAGRSEVKTDLHKTGYI